MKKYVIIVAGGVGTRMKSDRPKQFLEIAGLPVIIRTIQCFRNFDPAITIIICVHKDYQSHLQDLLQKHKLNELGIQITLGGDTRFSSVKNGLDLISDPSSVVGIHDAARPFVSQNTIALCYQTAADKGNAVPCVPIKESMRKINNNINNSVNRMQYRVVQTPQCFLNSKIQSAFQQDYNPAFTDDATVLEAMGEIINLVEGNEENIKITSPNDLFIAEAFAKRSS